MPLRATDDLGNNVLAFALNEDQWAVLRAENATRRHLRMPCCQAHVVLRTSSLGTQHFAHARRGPCTTAPESEEHLLAKMQAALGAQDAGWAVATEVAGTTPEGEGWVADVLATKGNARVAFEIQWSKQTDAETLARQARYARSGVRGMWLMRDPATVPDKQQTPVLKLAVFDAVPHVEIQSGFFSRQRPRPRQDWGLPTHLHLDYVWVPLREFVKAALSRRYQFAPLRGATVSLAIHGYPSLPCLSCGQPLRTISHSVLMNAEALPDYPNHRMYLPHGEAWLQQQIEAVLTPQRMRQLQLGAIGLKPPFKGSPKLEVKQYCARCGWYVAEDEKDKRLWALAPEVITSLQVRYPDTLPAIKQDPQLRYALYRWWFIDDGPAIAPLTPSPDCDLQA